MITKINQHTLHVLFTLDQEQIDEAVAAIREQVAAQGISELTDILGEAVTDVVDGLFDEDSINEQLHMEVDSLVSEQIEDLEEQYDEYLEAQSKQSEIPA
jgi:hypothetical protein